MKIQKRSHSYSDEIGLLHWWPFWGLDYELFGKYSSTTLSHNIAKACMMDKECKMFAFKNLSFRMVTQI